MENTFSIGGSHLRLHPVAANVSTVSIRCTIPLWAKKLAPETVAISLTTTLPLGVMEILNSRPSREDTVADEPSLGRATDGSTVSVTWYDSNSIKSALPSGESNRVSSFGSSFAKASSVGANTFEFVNTNRARKKNCCECHSTLFSQKKEQHTIKGVDSYRRS